MRTYRVVCARGCRLPLFAVIVCGVGFTGASSGLVGSGYLDVVGLGVMVGFVMLLWSFRGIGVFLETICLRVLCSCFLSGSTKYVLGSASSGRIATVPGSHFLDRVRNVDQFASGLRTSVNSGFVVSHLVFLSQLVSRDVLVDMWMS